MTIDKHMARPIDSTEDPVASPRGVAWDVDLSRPENSRCISQRNDAIPKEFNSTIEFFDSRQNRQQAESEKIQQILDCLMILQRNPKVFSEFMTSLERAQMERLEYQHSRPDRSTGERKNDNREISSGGSDAAHDTKNDSRHDTHKNPDDSNNHPATDGTPDRVDRVVHVKDGHQLESLKIEKGMTVKLEPGVHYKIQKGLQLPEGASIVGDKTNPPSIDFVGPTVNQNGKNFWPSCITVNGKDATVDGVKLECSGMQMYQYGGANGIFAGENADHLTVKNCSAGKINSFVALNGADNLTIDNCSVKQVNSYFLWNEHGSENTTIKNSRCDDSCLEWTVRSYGDNLTVENSQIGNKNKPHGPFKGALALYNGSATVKDNVIDGGIRIGPLNEAVHGLQYIDPKHPDRLRTDLTDEQKKKAEILHDSITVKATGNKITGWVSLNQNSDSYFADNQINQPTSYNGSWVAFTETKPEYAGFRDPAKGLFVNNQFSGPVQQALFNPYHTPVRIGAGNTLNGKGIA